MHSNKFFLPRKRTTLLSIIFLNHLVSSPLTSSAQNLSWVTSLISFGAISFLQSSYSTNFWEAHLSTSLELPCSVFPQPANCNQGIATENQLKVVVWRNLYVTTPTWWGRECLSCRHKRVGNTTVVIISLHEINILFQV